VRFTRPLGSDNLILSIAGTTDTLTVARFFAGDGAGGYAIEQITLLRVANGQETERPLVGHKVPQRIAVGMPITGHPPLRSVRARFGHTAPTSGA